MHTVPTTLKQLKELSGVHWEDADVSDPFIYEALNDITVLGETPEEQLALKQNPMKTCSNGLPELSTNFLSSIIQNIKPKSFSDILLIEGISHKKLTF